MNKAARLALAGLLLAALAAGLWAWRDHSLAQRRARLAAWQQYLRGPLSDLLEGSSRGRELLQASQRKPLNLEQRRALEAASDQVRAAAAAFAQPGQPWQDDPFFAKLRPAQRWHAELAELAKDWPRLAGRKDLLPDTFRAEHGLRQSLAGVLDQQREQVWKQLHPGQEAWLEMNALVYSLRE